MPFAATADGVNPAYDRSYFSDNQVAWIINYMNTDLVIRVEDKKTLKYILKCSHDKYKLNNFIQYKGKRFPSTPTYFSGIFFYVTEQ